MFLTRPEKERREIGLVLSPMSFSSCCLPVLFTVKLVVAARRPPRTSSWDCGFLLATDPGSSAGKTQKKHQMFTVYGEPATSAALTSLFVDVKSSTVTCMGNPYW